MRTMEKAMKTAIAIGTLLMLASGCESGSGSVVVAVEGEDGASGLSPTSEEPIVDGWTVEFDDYIVAVGHVELEGGGAALSAEGTTVVDLAAIGSPVSVARFDDVGAGAWPEVFYSTPIAEAGATRDESVSVADFDRMIAEGCTYLIRGRMTHPNGQSCARGDSTMCTQLDTIDFDFCVPAETEFGPCESDTGIEGITVTEGQTTNVTLSIHGDHLFFNGFPTGAEGSVSRRAQWLADSDLNADGTVTQTELESITEDDFGTLFADPMDGESGYSLENAEIEGGLTNAWQYVRAQLRTQGHFQGEGECAIDGHAHEHE